VLETARELRRISDDTTVVVIPGGINEHTVDTFVAGCDLVFDEIEFFAVGARILLHQRARQRDIPLMNCNVVGFGTRLFLYSHAEGTATMEQQLGLSYDAAKALEARARAGDMDAIRVVSERVLGGLVPGLPEYRVGDRDIVLGRLLREGKASIVATNPPQSTGFVANRAMLFLLERAGFRREHAVAAPEMPGYLFFDAATMEVQIVREAWWSW
jgi:hypothetical protein